MSDLTESELEDLSAQSPLAQRLVAEVRRRRQEDTRSIYTPPALAKLLGYSEERVRLMCEAGRFQGAYRAGDGSHWRIPQEAVQAFKEACRPRIRRRQVMG